MSASTRNRNFGKRSAAAAQYASLLTEGICTSRPGDRGMNSHAFI